MHMKAISILCYPKCGTCRKAVKWLEDNNIKYDYRDITLENPSVEELTRWVSVSGLPVRKFFNTSGLLYKSMNLKEKVAALPEDELIKILATDGRLVKRPVVLYEGGVLVGFDEQAWGSVLLKR